LRFDCSTLSRFEGFGKSGAVQSPLRIFVCLDSCLRSGYNSTFDREYFCKFSAGPTQFLEKDLILAAFDDSIPVRDLD